MKAGPRLKTGPGIGEIDGGEIEVALAESGFKARNFGTEPAGDVPVSVNGEAHLTLLDDGMNLDRAKSVGADAHVHLGIHLRVHLQIGGGIGRARRGRRRGWSGRRGVEHLMSLGKRGRGIGWDLRRSCGSRRRGSR